MSVKTYDGKQVSVIIGLRPATGLADGEFVTVERDQDAYTKVVGADGEVSRTKANNKAGKLTLTLMQTSAFNAYLSAFELAGTVFPIAVRDASGTTLCIAEEAWIQKTPNVTFGKEASDRAWVIDTGDMQVFVGGN